jgi:hypothetical protein
MGFFSWLIFCFFEVIYYTILVIGLIATSVIICIIFGWDREVLRWMEELGWSNYLRKASEALEKWQKERQIK